MESSRNEKSKHKTTLSANVWEQGLAPKPKIKWSIIATAPSYQNKATDIVNFAWQRNYTSWRRSTTLNTSTNVLNSPRDAGIAPNTYWEPQHSHVRATSSNTYIQGEGIHWICETPNHHVTVVKKQTIGYLIGPQQNQLNSRQIFTVTQVFWWGKTSKLLVNT